MRDFRTTVRWSRPAVHLGRVPALRVHLAHLRLRLATVEGGLLGEHARLAERLRFHRIGQSTDRVLTAITNKRTSRCRRRSSVDHMIEVRLLSSGALRKRRRRLCWLRGRAHRRASAPASASERIPPCPKLCDLRVRLSLTKRLIVDALATTPPKYHRARNPSFQSLLALAFTNTQFCQSVPSVGTFRSAHGEKRPRNAHNARDLANSRDGARRRAENAAQGLRKSCAAQLKI
eukprot:scaffold1227_cov256-Pinguiococcus_pyrenoidosus.AAC.6